MPGQGPDRAPCARVVPVCQLHNFHKLYGLHYPKQLLHVLTNVDEVPERQLKILFVLPETPETGGSGIATYLHHARTALRQAGHECMVVTWSSTLASETDDARTILVDPKAVTAAYSNSPWNVAVSFYLLPHILKAISDFAPDLIETSDYLAPMYSYLSHRRAGLLTPAQRVPVVTFNHGLLGEVYRANAVMPTNWARQDLAAERTALRWSDACFVPSHAAMKKLTRQVGKLNTTSLIREPYNWSGKPLKSRQTSRRYVHAGRVSFSKGVDHVIHFLNAVGTFADIDQVLLIGTVENFPFKVPDGRDYVLGRLGRALADKVEFVGKVPYDEMPSLMAPDGIPGFSMNFSRQETFNYVFLESIDQGLRPFTIDRSAMAEFYPENLHGLLIPHDFDLSRVQSLHERMSEDGSQIAEEIRSHAMALTTPSAFASRYEQLVERIVLSATLKNTKGARAKRYTGKDVTVIMASRNPNDYIVEAVNSVLDQTTMPDSIIVYDDGSEASNGTDYFASICNNKLVSVIRSSSNEGLCATRRKLIESVNTRLAIFLDDDDRLERQYIEKALKVMNENECAADAVITWRKNFGENEELISNYNLEDFEHYLTNDLRMTSLIRAEVLHALNFQPSMRNGEADDWDFWIRFNHYGYRAVLLPEPLFRYRLHSGSMSWPWTHGQAARTAELLAERLNEAILNGAVVPDLFLGLFGQHHGNQNSFAKWSAERGMDVHLARQKHPIVGGLLAIIFRASASLARRIK